MPLLVELALVATFSLTKRLFNAEHAFIGPALPVELSNFGAGGSD